MKKLTIILLVLAVFAIQQLNAQKANNPYVHCVVLDKTLSMTGHGGSDIWAEVQNYCYEWIDGIQQPAMVLLFTFDKDLYGPQKFAIETEVDKGKFKDAVKNIVVDGRFTYISSNIGKAIDHVYANYPKSTNNHRIYLITDGIEEETGSDLAGVLNRYCGKRGDYDYLYYVDLRDMAPQSTKDLISDTEGADIGKGFVKFLTISPVLQTVNYVLGASNSFDQQFVVMDEDLFSGMSFDAKIDSVVKIGVEGVEPNVNLNPSMNINGNKMERIEEGKYKISFTLDFINNSKCECDVYVGLVGRNQGDKILNFEPTNFRIQVRNQAKPSVKIKKGW